MDTDHIEAAEEVEEEALEEVPEALATAIIIEAVVEEATITQPHLSHPYPIRRKTHT